MSSPVRILCLLGIAALSLAAGCPLDTVEINAPKPDSLLDDPSIALDVKVGRNYVATSAVVRIDGVDLAAALGMVPPFAGASGNVTIGGAVVAVGDFTYTLPPSASYYQVTATLTGLPAGDHAIDAEAQLSEGGVTAESSHFSVVTPFTLAAGVIASAGTPPPAAVVAGNHVGSASLGESLAGPPVAVNGGGQLRAGFVPAAQGRAGRF